MSPGSAPRSQPANLRWKLPAMTDEEAQADEGMAARTSVCETQLKQALDKRDLADVRFEVEGEWVVSGHRSVLSSRSRVFASMLGNDTKERRSGVIKLDDVTSAGLVLFLEFVYLGRALFLPLCYARGLFLCLSVELQNRQPSLAARRRTARGM